MIVIDTSALVAIIRLEPEAEQFVQRMKTARARYLSASSYLEVFMVLAGASANPSPQDLDFLLFQAGIQVVPFDDVQARLASEAFRRFGKGRHAAKLNYGDCFAYALAKVKGAPLLFKGDDFSQTDVDVA